MRICCSPSCVELWDQRFDSSQALLDCAEPCLGPLAQAAELGDDLGQLRGDPHNATGVHRNTSDKSASPTPTTRPTSMVRLSGQCGSTFASHASTRSKQSMMLRAAP